MSNPERRATNRFRLLLRLLPAEFRGDFGPEMEQVFVAQREEAAREGGKMGIWRLWWETAKGIFTTAPREHLTMLRQDSAFALRMMRKNLGFTLAAIIVLGLGIGANTAIFSAKPLLGRNFAPDDEKPGAPAVLLLSYEYWLRSFGGDPTVIGKVFRMNDKPHTVIGVLPPFPQYPQENDVYMPSTACPFRMDPMMMASRTDRMVRMFGRMKPGVRTAQAEADLSAVAASMQKEFPDAYPQDSALKVDAAPLKSELTRDAKPTMLFLLAAAGFVLLIACANVANLNLARMVRRERELGVRTAMGASRVRLFRQLLTESSLLALLGGALGLLLATGGLQLLSAYVARFTPRAREVHIDLTVLLFTLGIALFVSVLTGTAPAVARRENLITTLKEGSTQSTLGSARGKLRGALIVAQVAVSFLLLIGAGLTVRSLINLQRVDPGFRPENVLTIQFSLDFSRYTTNENTLAFWDSLLEKTKSLPGVMSVAAAGDFPLDKSPAFSNQFQIEGRQGDSADAKPIAELNVITPEYLSVLGIPLFSGRNFDQHDQPTSPHVALINQSTAQRYWHNEDPVGKRILFQNIGGGTNWTQIIGVIGDVHEHGLDVPANDFIYLPFTQYPQNGPALMARTQGDPMAVARAVVQRLYEVDPNQPAGRIQSLEQYRADSIAAPRLTTNLLGLFALLALA